MIRTTFVAVAIPWVVAWAIASTPVHAIYGVSIEAGNGNGVDMGRIGLQLDWKKRWFQGNNWHVGGHWDLAAGYWDRNALPGQNDSITDIGLTPVFRLQQNDLKGPYLEAAVGLHLLSKTSTGDRRLSTRFQFGDHVGIGYRFGAKGAFDRSYRYQHLSNGDIKRPNNGINFNQIRLRYHF